MFRKLAAILILFVILLLIPACTTLNEEAPLPGEQESPSQVESSSSLDSSQSEAGTGVGADSNPATHDTEAYQNLIKDMIAQYNNGSIETSDMFPALPEGLIFPDDVSGLEFKIDELGYTTTIFVDKSETYEIYIRIDDMTDAGVRPEGNPHIRSVNFSKIA